MRQFLPRPENEVCLVAHLLSHELHDRRGQGGRGVTEVVSEGAGGRVAEVRGVAAGGVAPANWKIKDEERERAINPPC